MNKPKYKLRGLLEQLAEVDAQLAPIRAAMRETVLAEVIAKIQEFDFDTIELGLVKTQQIKSGRDGASTFKQKAKTTKLAPLYRDPATGATWTGRGRTPHWLDGHQDEYLIRD